MTEFVPKGDAMVKELLTNRPDIFPDYTEEAFRSHLKARARIVKEEQVSEAGRKLFWVERE